MSITVFSFLYAKVSFCSTCAFLSTGRNVLTIITQRRRARRKAPTPQGGLTCHIIWGIIICWSKWRL